MGMIAIYFRSLLDVAGIVLTKQENLKKYEQGVVYRGIGNLGFVNIINRGYIFSVR